MDRAITKLFLADEQRIVRAGLRHVLAPRSEFQIVGEASDLEGSIRGIVERAPDIVLCEIQSPGLDGLELMRSVKKQLRSTRFLIFSALDHRARASEAMRAGAAGYLLKNSAPNEILAAIDAVRVGGMYLAPAVARPVVDAQNRGAEIAGSPALLSRRQREILRLVAEGFSTKEIGEQLGLKLRTVESHRHALMKKLNVNRVAHLVRYAIRENLVSA